MTANSRRNHSQSAAATGPSVTFVLSMLGFFLAIGSFSGQYLSTRVLGMEGTGLNTALGVGIVGGAAVGLLMLVVDMLPARRGTGR